MWHLEAIIRQLASKAGQSAILTMAGAPKRFSIALSFPGMKRAFVAEVASRLAQRIGRDRVLYDRFYEAEFARPDLDTHLQGLYHDESELIAVFLCAEYERNEWCGLEWRAVRDLIKRRDASTVMPLRFDNTEIPGLFSIDGYVWIGGREPKDIADLILERFRLLNAEFSGPGRPDRHEKGTSKDYHGTTRSIPDLGIARAFQRKTKPFRDEYLASETGQVPFGGRDVELQRLDAWIFDVKASPRMLVTAPAGRGKSALLVHWMKSLEDRSLIAEDKWQLAFVPISIRVGTNPAFFWVALPTVWPKSLANL